MVSDTAADDLQIRGRAAWDSVLRLARAGRPQEALAELEGLWAAWGGSPSPWGRELRARLLAETAEAARAAGDTERALALLGSALADIPGAADLSHALACIHLERGEDAAAGAVLEAALAATPAHAPCAVELALLEARSGRLGDAVKRLEGLAASWAPSDRARLASGMARLRRGSWEAAGEELRTAGPEGERTLATALRQIGALLAAGEAVRALAEATSSTDRCPGSPAAHSAVGLCCLTLGWWDDALEAFGRALALAPADHCSRLYLAWVFFQRGEAAAAEAEVVRVLDACPGHELALALWRQRCGSRPATRLRPAA